MLSKVTSFALAGLDGVPVTAETDINNGLPSYELVGLPDAAVKESRERVRSALKNSGKKFPSGKITDTRAPPDLKCKDGAASIWDISLIQRVARLALQRRMMDRFHLGMPLQIFHNLQRVFHMPFHTKRQCLQPLKQKKGVKR